MDRRFVALLLMAFGCAATTQAGVTVTHGDPDRFTDAGDRSNDPVKVMQALEKHLVLLGERYLPAGRNARIEVLDVDRAGRPRMNMPGEIRIMTGKADSPCIDLRYQVEADGKLSSAQRERVCDLDYLRPVGPRNSPNDPLAYEKRMLEDWFKARIAEPRRP